LAAIFLGKSCNPTDHFHHSHIKPVDIFNPMHYLRPADFGKLRKLAE